MTSRGNLGASVGARLLKRARETGDAGGGDTPHLRAEAHTHTADDPIGLTPAYWENPSRPAQVRAFARRAGLEFPDAPANEFTSLLRAFLMPLLDDLRRGTPGDGTWRSGGPGAEMSAAIHQLPFFSYSVKKRRLEQQ